VTYAQLIYALQCCAVLTGVLTSASIAGRFLFALPSLLAVLLNYARRAEARGTWLQSHWDWQIHTFWYALLWIGITLLIGAPLTLLFVGIYIVLMGFSIVGLWVAYRAARGWLGLYARRRMPVPALAAAAPAGGA
jgi:uncharacterized membrane protein